MAISAEALSAIPQMLKRPPLAPPKELTEEQKGFWREIVADLPDGHIKRDNAPVLRDLVRHMAYSCQIAQQLDGLHKRILNNGTEGNRRFRATVRELLDMHRVQSHAVAQLSVKLRLTPQTQQLEVTAERRRARTPSSPPPWQDDSQDWEDRPQ